MIRSAVLIQYTRVTDGRTDGIGVAHTRYSMLSRVKMNSANTCLETINCNEYNIEDKELIRD